jgi:hypothetical protein
MKSFKQFFFESVESEANLPPPPEKFSVPPPRAKFQLGDVVLIQNPQPSDKDYVKRNMPKYLHDYTNAIGRVIGHRTIGGGSYITTEFALEFEDGKIGKAKSLLLVGPFRSIQTAKKYQGRKELTSNDIAPEDHKRHAEAATEIESNEDIENTFKKLFVKEGEFAWLTEPLSFVDGKIRVIILAYKPTFSGGYIFNNCPSSIPKEIGESQIFYKKVDLISNKLVKTASFNHQSMSSAYGMSVPEHRSDSTTFVDGKLNVIGVMYSKMAINTSKGLVKFYNESQKIKELEKLKDGMTYFDLINNVRTQGSLKIVPENAGVYHKLTLVHESITKDINAFKNYIFEGSLSTRCLVNGQFVFPKEVKGELCVADSESKIENLKGFPKLSKNCEVRIGGPVKSYEGLPPELNHKLVVRNVLSLKGFPKVINGDCEMDKVESFAGGENTVINGMLIVNKGPSSYKEIPEAKHYVLHNLSSDKADEVEKWVQQRKKMLSTLEKEFDMSALDGF